MQFKLGNRILEIIEGGDCTKCFFNKYKVCGELQELGVIPKCDTICYAEIIDGMTQDERDNLRVGREFIVDGVKLKVRRKLGDECSNCYYNEHCINPPECRGSYREDGIDVYFEVLE